MLISLTHKYNLYMNIRSLKEFNRFKELVCSSSKEVGWPDEVKMFRAIKEAEDAEIDECMLYARRFILAGVVKDNSRPIVYNYDEGSVYPKPEKFAFFPKIDLFQNIIELQDAIDVVPDLKTDLGIVEEPFDTETMELFSVNPVFGKSIKKGNKLVPHLTLGEVTSQLAGMFPLTRSMIFYVCDAAEECGKLTTHAGYHAYRVAVYSVSELSDGMYREISIDGHLMATLAYDGNSCHRSEVIV